MQFKKSIEIHVISNLLNNIKYIQSLSNTISTLFNKVISPVIANES